MHFTRLFFLSWVILAATQLSGRQRTILIIHEGLGQELFSAASILSDDPEIWDWQLDHTWSYAALSTLPLTPNTAPDGTDPSVPPVYDTFKAWDATQTQNQDASPSFEGYQWLISHSPDPLQALTAFNAGIHTFKGSCNWLNYPAKEGGPVGTPKLLTERAASTGMKVGLISDMPFLNPSVMNLAGLRTDRLRRDIDTFEKVLETTPLSLLVATGHPKYNEMGQALSEPNYSLFSQGEWQDLRSECRERGWSLIFGNDNLLGITQENSNENAKKLIIMQFGDTQITQSYKTNASGFHKNLPTSQKFQVNLALNYLDRNESGFLLVIHMGRLPYLIRAKLQTELLDEVIGSLELLKSCEQWVDDNGGWSETSLILMSPYEYGLIWGSDANVNPFSPVTDRGANRLPGFNAHHMAPTACLTPVLFKGNLVKELQQSLEQAPKDPVYGPFLSLPELHDIIASSTKAEPDQPENP
jgi:hypothetical protein